MRWKTSNSECASRVPSLVQDEELHVAPVGASSGDALVLGALPSPPAGTSAPRGGPGGCPRPRRVTAGRSRPSYALKRVDSDYFDEESRRASPGITSRRGAGRRLP